jgi:hypothetical protein
MKIINTCIKLYSHYSVPKPVFHSVTGKKSSSLRAQQEVNSPQHAELINFIYECELTHLMFTVCELKQLCMKTAQIFGYLTYFELQRCFSDLMMATGKHFLKVQHVVEILY